MAEIVIAADDDLPEVAQALLDLAGDQPDQVMWAPRPDVPHGGVYVVPDELGEKYSGAPRKGRRSKADTKATPATTAAPATTETTETTAPKAAPATKADGASTGAAA